MLQYEFLGLALILSAAELVPNPRSPCRPPHVFHASRQRWMGRPRGLRDRRADHIKGCRPLTAGAHAVRCRSPDVSTFLAPREVAQGRVGLSVRHRRHPPGRPIPTPPTVRGHVSCLRIIDHPLGEATRLTVSASLFCLSSLVNKSLARTGSDLASAMQLDGGSGTAGSVRIHQRSSLTYVCTPAKRAAGDNNLTRVVHAHRHPPHG